MQNMYKFTELDKRETFPANLHSHMRDKKFNSLFLIECIGFFVG